MLLLVLLSLSSPQALAQSVRPPPPGCAEATRSSALLSSVTQAVAAYEALDQSSFVAASLNATTTLPCMGEVLSVTTASAYARMMGLGAQLEGDVSSRQAWFRAALTLDPGGDLGEKIAPVGHPLRTAWDEAREAPKGPRVELSLPPTAITMVDGKASSSRPEDRPALIQILDQNTVRWTSFAWPAPVPPTAAALGMPEAAPIAEVSAPVDRRWGARQSLLLGAGVSAAAGAGLYAVAWQQRVAFDDPTNTTLNTTGAIDQAARGINRIVLGSVGLGLVGVGLSTTALVALER